MSGGVTKGQWAGFALIVVDGVSHIGVGIVGTSKVVALTGKYHAKDEAESIANARLIAAAPDLLAALIEVAAANTEALATMAEDEITPPQWFVDQCEQVKAAIAKATGTTP